MNPTVNVKRALTIASYVGVFLLGTVGATIGFVGVTSSNHAVPSPVIVMTPSPVPVQNTEVSVSEALPTPSASPLSTAAVELVPGSKGNEYDATYKCKEGYYSLQVPVGRTEWKDGAKFVLEEKRTSYDQESVTLNVTLPANWSARALIVNTTAHNRAPKLYPQHMLAVNVPAGGTATWRMNTDAYAQNYFSGGISDITVCLAPSSES